MTSPALKGVPSPGSRARSRAYAVARGLVELGLLLVLYVAYSASRLLASDDIGSAQERALQLLHLERDWFLAWETTVNGWFADIPALGIFGSYYYATAHYVVTAVVLIWVYRQGADIYRPARRALLGATVLGLVGYLRVPMAPPRLTDTGHIDVLREFATAGWWGADASAPRGFGQYTNELAAMPSLHAGWALWVLIALTWAGAPLLWRRLAVAHVVITAVVVVGTGNHWVLDVVGGWAVVALAAYVVRLGGGPQSSSEMRYSPSVNSSERVTSSEDSVPSVLV